MPTISGLSTPIDRAVFAGGPAGSPLPRAEGAGIDPADDLVAVRHISDDLVTNADVKGEATIPATGQLQLSTTDTTGDFVVALFKKAE